MCIECTPLFSEKNQAHTYNLQQQTPAAVLKTPDFISSFFCGNEPNLLSYCINPRPRDKWHSPHVLCNCAIQSPATAMDNQGAAVTALKAELRQAAALEELMVREMRPWCDRPRAGWNEPLGAESQDGCGGRGITSDVRRRDPSRVGVGGGQGLGVLAEHVCMCGEERGEGEGYGARGEGKTRHL